MHASTSVITNSKRPVMKMKETFINNGFPNNLLS